MYLYCSSKFVQGFDIVKSLSVEVKGSKVTNFTVLLALSSILLWALSSTKHVKIFLKL